MVGAVCTVVFVGATMSLVTQHSRQRQFSREMALAANAATDNLEALRNLDIVDLPGRTGTGFDVPSDNGGPGGLNTVAGDVDGLCGSIDVALAQSSGSCFLYRVTVRVTWTGVAGDRAISFQTLMGDRR